MDSTINKNICEFLKALLFRQISPQDGQWLTERLRLIEKEPVAKNLYIFFGAAPRFIDEGRLALTSEDLQKASSLRAGWHLDHWSTVQAARVLAVLSYPYHKETSFVETIERLFTTGEVRELVALYSALPVLPFPNSLKLRAAEGIRTNMTVVFDAVALNNPYPFDYLDKDPWNQMILKALFMSRPLYKIWGIDDRSNYSLSKMISDFAHERWAAGRNTSPEMWRPIKQQPVEEIYEDLRKLLTMEDSLQRAAAVLAARELATVESKALLEEFKEIVSQIDVNSLTWEAIGEQWNLQEELSNN